MLNTDDVRHHTEVGTGYRKDEQLARAADEIDRLRAALAELAKYFTSGNSVPVERATILAKDFCSITGMTPNVI
jgi:hypothetical protein